MPRPLRRSLRLAAACWAITSPALAQNTTTFPLSLVDNRVFVGVDVNGRGPFAFLLDTGSSSSTVETPLAAHLQLKPVGAATDGGAGENKVHFAVVHLASLALGPFELGSMDVPSLDDRQLAHVVGFQKFDGVLGAEIFKNHIVTLDAGRARLTIQSATNYHSTPAAIAVPIELNQDDYPVVAGAINGISGRFLVDTGDRSSLTMFGPFWRAHQLDQSIGSAVTAMTGFGVGGPIRGMVGRPSSFSFGGIAVPAPVARLSLQKGGAFTSAAYAGSIGMGILKRFVVSFDYPHKTMWLVKSPDFAQRDRYDRSGAWLGLGNGDQLTVVDVVQTGPAARAGVKPGDTVVAIDDVPATPDHLFSLRRLLLQPAVSSVEFHIVRHGMPMTIPVILEDLITPAG